MRSTFRALWPLFLLVCWLAPLFKAEVVPRPIDTTINVDSGNKLGGTRAPDAPVKAPSSPERVAKGAALPDAGPQLELEQQPKAILVRLKKLKRKKKKAPHTEVTEPTFDYSVYGPACQKAVVVMKDTIGEWDKLIGNLRVSLEKGAAPGLVQMAPKARIQMESRLTTLQGYADGARRALMVGNLKQVNQRCRQGGLELAKLAFNAEALRLEPALAQNARAARQVYKNYRQACGGPAF